MFPPRHYLYFPSLDGRGAGGDGVVRGVRPSAGGPRRPLPGRRPLGPRQSGAQTLPEDGYTFYSKFITTDF